MTFKILQGDNRQTLKTLADNSVDAIVTDPPYGIDFLGKDWDANTGSLETYKECLRVLKPGGHILAFSAARTYHHLAITLEQAGFEIRDQIMWIYSSGFPKSQDVGRSIQRSLGVKEKYKPTGPKSTTPRKNPHANILSEAQGKERTNGEEYEIEMIKVTDPEAKAWEGWGTALKPAHEPIALARKPLKQSIAKNVQQWGTGALNIDACRIATTRPPKKQVGYDYGATIGGADPLNRRAESSIDHQYEPNEHGRFPSNVLGEIPDYQKYFYCPKVSRAERHVGFESDNVKKNYGQMYGPEQMVTRTHYNQIATELTMLADMGGYYIDAKGYKTEVNGKNIWLPQTGNIYIHGLKEEYRKWCEANGKTPNVGNNHPTVKPVELMKYLITLVTPPGGTVLDPFCGSGSTGMAAVELGHAFIGCELNEDYVVIANRRIEAWQARDPITASGLFEECP